MTSSTVAELGQNRSGPRNSQLALDRTGADQFASTSSAAFVQPTYAKTTIIGDDVDRAWSGPEYLQVRVQIQHLRLHCLVRCVELESTSQLH